MVKHSSTWISQFHRIWYSAWVILIFIGFYPLLWFYTRNATRYFPQLVRIRKKLAVYSAFFGRFTFSIKEQTPVDWSNHYVICANHTSNLDITAMMKVCQHDFSFIGKQELLDNPVTALFFRSIDIPINRSSKVSAYKAFIKAKDRLSQNKSVVIFPEGGINDHFPPELTPFKTGAFKLAMETGVPILPVVIHDAWKCCWDDGIEQGMHPGMIHITILAAIDTHSFQDAEALSDEVYSKMNETLVKSKRNKIDHPDSN